MTPRTEFARDFCAGIGPLQLGVVLFVCFFCTYYSLSLPFLFTFSSLKVIASWNFGSRPDFDCNEVRFSKCSFLWMLGVFFVCFFHKQIPKLCVCSGFLSSAIKHHSYLKFWIYAHDWPAWNIMKTYFHFFAFLHFLTAMFRFFRPYLVFFVNKKRHFFGSCMVRCTLSLRVFDCGRKGVVSRCLMCSFL